MQQTERRRPESLWSWLIIENKKCMMGIFHGPAGAAWHAFIIIIIIMITLSKFKPLTFMERSDVFSDHVFWRF